MPTGIDYSFSILSQFPLMLQTSPHFRSSFYQLAASVSNIMAGVKGQDAPLFVLASTHPLSPLSVAESVGGFGTGLLGLGC